MILKRNLRFVVLLFILCAGGWAGYAEAAKLKPETQPRPDWWPYSLEPPYSTIATDAAGIKLMVAAFDPEVGEPALPAELRSDRIAVDRDRVYVIVQFKGPVYEAWKLEIEQAGIELLEYVPDFAFIARVSSAKLEQVGTLPNIAWVGRYHAAYKLNPLIGKLPLSSPERVADSKFTLVVNLFPNESMTQLAESIESLGGEIIDRFIGARSGFIVKLHPTRIAELAKIEAVRWIEEYGEFFTMNDETQEVVQSGSVSGGTPVWNNNIKGQGQIVGHLDTGVDADHCFFYDSSQSLPGSTPNYNHDKIVAYRLYGSGLSYDGCDGGHGTHTAGTVAGYAELNGYAGTYDGVAPLAKLTVGDIGRDTSTDCNYGYLYPPSTLDNVFADTLSDGGYIHTNSWGGSSNTYDSYAEDCDTFMWNNKDFLILFAAGNSGPNASTVSYPATAKNIVCVGGSDQDPNQNTMYYYSSRGPVATSNRMAPLVTAPATDTAENPDGLHSSYSDGGTTGLTCVIESDYYSGTSMACPAVAGSAALIRQYYVDGWYPTGAAVSGNGFIPTAALLKASLANSAVNMTNATARPSNVQGWGRVNLNEVLYFSGETRTLIIRDDSTGLTTAGQYQQTFQVTSSTQSLKVTLAWTDRAGNTLVNDLDLRLTTGSTTWYGNNFSNSWSSTGTTVDRTNPVECVFLQTPATGSYTVTVYAYNVPQGETGGRQPYSLVISGAVSATTGPTATPTASPTITSSPTATRTPTRSPTRTGTRTATLTPTVTQSATRTATLTPTLSPTATPSRTPTSSPTRSATLTPTLSPTVTSTPQFSYTPTSTPTITPTPVFTYTATPTYSPSLTATFSPTSTPTRTATLSPTRTPTLTPSLTSTPIPTSTFTPTPTQQQSPSATPLPGSNIPIAVELEAELNPAMIRDANDWLYIAYEHAYSADDHDLYLDRSTDSGVTWQTYELETSELNFGNPVLSAAADGKMYASYENNNANDSNFYYAESTDSGATWTHFSIELSGFVASDADNPAIAVSGSGSSTVVYFAYQYQTPTSPYDADILYFVTYDGGSTWYYGYLTGWTDAEDRYPSIGIGSSKVVIMFESEYSSTDHDIVAGYRNITGGTWSKVGVVTTEDDERYPSGSATGVNVFIAYEQVASGVYGVSSTDQGATWGSISAIATLATAPVADITSSGIRVAYETSDDLYFATSTDSGSSWFGQQEVTDGGHSITAGTGTMSIVYGETLPFLAWEDSRSGNLDIYFDWPILPTATPTQVPTETPEPSATPALTPTPLCSNDGDVNNDLSITAGDAQTAFQITLGMYTPTFEEFCSADCNGDATVTAGDAQTIFYAAIGAASCVDQIN